MDFLARIKCVLGMDDADLIELRDLEVPVHPGDELRATAALSGGEHGLDVEGVRLRLDEERLVYDNPRHGDFDFWREAAAVTVPLAGRSLAPGERLSVPLTLQLPADLEPSSAHRRYRITAILQARGRHHDASAVIAVVR